MVVSHRSRRTLQFDAYRITAARLAGYRTADSFPDWACRALVYGYDSESLRLLASESRSANWLDISTLVDAACVDLGIELIDGDDAVWFAAFDLAKQVIRDPGKANDVISLLNGMAYAWLDYPDELMGFYTLHDYPHTGSEPNGMKPEAWRKAVLAEAKRFTALARFDQWR